MGCDLIAEQPHVPYLTVEVMVARAKPDAFHARSDHGLYTSDPVLGIARQSESVHRVVGESQGFHTARIFPLVLDVLVEDVAVDIRLHRGLELFRQALALQPKAHGVIQDGRDRAAHLGDGLVAVGIE